MKNPTEKLILGLKADKSDVEIHQHSAFQIVFTEDYPFQTSINNTVHQNIFGFVIRPQVAHSCVCSQSILSVINVEPFSFLGKIIASKLKENKSLIFENKRSFQTFFEINQDSEVLQAIINIGETEIDKSTFDERINKTILYIQQNFQSDKFSIQDLANYIFLSPSRLSSLFKQQIGSSISKYLLWTRLRNAIFLILMKKDKSITEIALESGFYDSSQMNKYMYQMFGITPSKLRIKSDLIQFLETEPN
ncbi:MAG: AraC family transcriptional regulator [Bacteroidetes bacterium]|nr:AraC family transcriptional regulator [Bacteroidota bacterium]